MKYKLHIAITVLIISFITCSKPNNSSVQTTEEIIKLDTTSIVTGLPADGKTILQFVATIPHNSSTDLKDIVFTISDANIGKFIGTSKDLKQTIKSNAEGTATCSVQIGTVPGKYFISAEIKIGDITYQSQNITIVISPLSNADKVQLMSDNYEPIADGASLITLTVKSTFSQDKKATLTSNMGTFVGSADSKAISLILDDQGGATTPYKLTNETGPNFITAKLTDGSFVTIIINPKNSYPDILLTEVSALRIDLIGGSIQINTYLKKLDNSFKVTKNTQVYFSAKQIVNNIAKDVGRFTGINLAVSDADGIVPPVKFFADSGNVTADVPIIIEVSVFKSSSEKIVVPIQVTVKP